MQPATNHSTKRLKNARTCIGCAKRDVRGSLVRLVLSTNGSMVFDFAGREAGRGAHVHPSSDCIAKAARKGLSRAFKANLAVQPRVMSNALAAAAEGRVAELVAIAADSGLVDVDPEAIGTGLREGRLQLAMVASDAPSNVLRGELGNAVLLGKAVAWGTCASLGALARRESLAVLGIKKCRLGDAVAWACRVADGSRTGAEVR